MAAFHTLFLSLKLRNSTTGVLGRVEREVLLLFGCGVIPCTLSAVMGLSPRDSGSHFSTNATESDCSFSGIHTKRRYSFGGKVLESTRLLASEFCISSVSLLAVSSKLCTFVLSAFLSSSTSDIWFFLCCSNATCALPDFSFHIRYCWLHCIKFLVKTVFHIFNCFHDVPVTAFLWICVVIFCIPILPSSHVVTNFFLLSVFAFYKPFLFLVLDIVVPSCFRTPVALFITTVGLVIKDLSALSSELKRCNLSPPRHTGSPPPLTHLL